MDNLSIEFEFVQLFELPFAKLNGQSLEKRRDAKPVRAVNKLGDFRLCHEVRHELVLFVIVECQSTCLSIGHDLEDREDNQEHL